MSERFYPPYDRPDTRGVLRPRDFGWVDYTPSLTAATTSPTLGTGSVQEGRYLQVGDLVMAVATVKFGTSGTAAGSGTFYLSLPVNVSDGLTVGQPLGHGFVWDDSAGLPYLVVPQRRTTDASTVLLRLDGTAAVTEAAPFGWAASDFVTVNLCYEAA